MFNGIRGVPGTLSRTSGTLSRTSARYGELEVFVQTFEHGLDVFTVPGSQTNCLAWPTARGGPLRMGQ